MFHTIGGSVPNMGKCSQHLGLNIGLKEKIEKTQQTLTNKLEEKEKNCKQEDEIISLIKELKQIHKNHE